MTRRSVDLPQPFGPMSATIRPAVDRQVDAVERHVRLGALAAGNVDRQVVEADVPAHGADHVREAAQDRRGRRVERDVGVEDARRTSAASSGRGSSRWSIRVIASMAASMSGCAPIPTAPRIAEPSTAVSRTSGTATGKPVTSALIRFQVSLRAGPPQARISSTRTPAASIGAATWRMASADASRMARARWPRPCASVRPAKTPRAVGSQIGERSPARYGRKTRPSAPGGVAAASPMSASVPIVAGEDPVAIPVERPAGRGHRRADAVAARQRGRRDERARRPRPARASRRRSRRRRRPGRRRRRGRAGRRRGSSRRRRRSRPRPGCRHGARARRRPARSARRRPCRSRRVAAACRPGRRPRPRCRGPRRSGSGSAGRRRCPRGGTRATPRSRGTSASRRPRSARGARPRARPGVRPSAQPRTPVAAASSAASPVERVSSKVIAGRVASPRASTGTSVGPCPSTPIATTSARTDSPTSRTARTTADHQAAGSCSAQPCSGPTAIG